jgi:hypothetical protein
MLIQKKSQKLTKQKKRPLRSESPSLKKKTLTLKTSFCAVPLISTITESA